LAGALWGAVPGLLKAYFNINEVIACIMMNYIGMYLVNYLITRTVFDSLRNQSQRVGSAATLPKWGLDAIFRDGNAASSANSGIFLAVVAAVVLYIVLDKTKFGYELKACGLNRDAARYAGINENKSIILSMAIAGAMAGLGGAFLYLAGSGKGYTVVDTLAVEGFDGIAVALLGMNNPIGIIFAGLFIAYLTVGGFTMQLYNYAPQVIEIITAVIIYFSAFVLLLKGGLGRLTAHLAHRATTAKGGDAQ
jgi:simple sugar transport system permease protein